MVQQIFQNLFEGERSIPPMCPWYDHQVKYGIPNIKWCEESICSYVVEPANTWSNVGYLIIALLIFWKANKNSHRDAIWLAPSIFAMGAMSLFYHATTNGYSQYLDFLGMYFTVSLIASYNLVRGGFVKMSNIILPWLGLIFAYTGIYFLFAKVGIKIQLIIVIAVAVILGIELVIKFKQKQVTKYKDLIIALSFIIVAEVFSLLDVNRIWCNPKDHILQGHAVWHVLSAIGFWFVYKFYSQFKLEDK